MADELSILLNARLNRNQSKIDIDKQIRRLENQINAVNLKFNLDNKTLVVLKNFSEAMKKVNISAKDLNNTYREEETVLKKLDGSTEKQIRQFQKNGEIIEKTKKIINEKAKSSEKDATSTDKQTQALLEYNAALEKNGELQKIVSRENSNGYTGGSETYKNGFTDTIYNLNKEQQVTSTKTTENLAKQAQAAEKDEIAIKKLTQQLEIYKREAGIKAENLTRRFGEHVDDRKIATYLKDVESLNTATPELQHRMRQLNTSFKEIGASASTSASHIMSFKERFATALKMIPAWLGATTAIFGTIRATESMISSIKMVNTQMTELRRVLNGTPEMFNNMLKQSISLSNELGRNLNDTLDIMSNYARQGYNQDQIYHLTKVSALLQNISDLNSQQSMDVVTAAMKNFNIEASKSIKIADSLNQVDNQYAVTTKQLSMSLFKAASTASTFGVSMDQLIGYTAAIGTVTRESGNVIGNSLKTIFSRITTMGPAIQSLADIGINIKNSSGEIKKVSTILDQLHSRWSSLSRAQKEHIGVELAGRRQLSRFLALTF